MDCQSFLHRLLVLLSADLGCWQRGLKLKAFVSQEKGWDLEGTEYTLTSVARVENSGDVMGFYSNLAAILSKHPIHPAFQVGDYNYEWEPVKKFTLHRLNLCDSQTYPWQMTSSDLPPRMGYEGMGRRMISRGKILTCRWTRLCQGNKVVFIERQMGSTTDAEIVECTVAQFHNKFRGAEGADSSGYHWGKIW